jgi:hypothetical protein
MTENFSSFKPIDSSRFEAAICRFDEENARDPNVEAENGVDHPREFLYAKRLSEWILKLCPAASEELRLAGRCQHICRWSIPRNSYEMNRTGYLQWRSDLKKFHAAKAREILQKVGYPVETIRRVQDLNLKKGFPKDPETQLLEDALCLVFLQYQFAGFIKDKEESKLIDIVQKTWKKMSPAARDCALRLPFADHESRILKKALS